MNNKAHTREKRTQRNYNLGFKLAVVSEVEKGQLDLQTNPKNLWYTRQKHCFGLA